MVDQPASVAMLSAKLAVPVSTATALPTEVAPSTVHHITTATPPGVTSAARHHATSQEASNLDPSLVVQVVVHQPQEASLVAATKVVRHAPSLAENLTRVPVAVDRMAVVVTVVDSTAAVVGTAKHKTTAVESLRAEDLLLSP